ncbi:DUF4127 family protein [Georgenia subflava]|uniref:DUF4127 family protein n=1 Tax=Georgenia subflava TaxID=1622177 RepID=A0A6N7EDQ0_9MICO|nr:DUF4127 family protein [Georgenia subflava]MPV35461.1 DUF4127 family protein [Georgenia subflava]
MRTLGTLVAGVSLVATTLLGAVPAAAGPADQAGPPDHAGPPRSLGEIAVVPIDDRPFPASTPISIAEAGGHTALAPPVGMLGEFFDYGDADGVGEWWQAAASEADGSVVAVSMLAYGGLMASRVCDTDLETARARLEVLEDVKAADPDHPVYAFDVIQRLTIAPTSSYPGMYSGEVRRWAELMDRVENLGHEDLRGEYEEVAASIPQEIKDDYLCARARNHEINKDMIRAAAAGTVDYLVLGQDDASEFGPHRAEKEALAALISELGVADRVKIYPGADTLGALLVAKHVVERLDVSPTVDVEWSRTPGEDWVAPYQDVPYAELVDAYVGTLGAERSDAPDADVLLMANTSGAGSLEPFVDRIHEAVARGRLVAVGDDAVAGMVDPELRDLLTPRIDVAELGAWSGWNVGISLSQSVVRAALTEASRTQPLLAGSPSTRGEPVLEARRQLLENAAAAHQELLFQELVHTDLYRHQVRDEVRRLAVDAGDDPQHFTVAFDEANELAVEQTRPLAQALFAEEFQGVPVRLGSDGRTEHSAVITDLGSLELGLSWPRYQELDVAPEIVLDRATQPASLVSAALLPWHREIRPEVSLDLAMSAVLRNDTGHEVDVRLSTTVPDGWTPAEPQVLTLAPFEVREVPVPVTTAVLAPEETQTVELVVEQERADGGAAVAPARASSTITAVWRNVALASAGASVAASGWWNQYAPERVIDGNTASTASRWITDAAGAHWLEVTLAGTEPVDTVQLYQYGNYELNDYTISALVDGDWQVVADVVGNTETAPVHQFDAVETTALRLDVTASRDSRVRLYEIEATCRTSTLCD